MRLTKKMFEMLKSDERKIRKLADDKDDKSFLDDLYEKTGLQDEIEELKKDNEELERQQEEQEKAVEENYENSLHIDKRDEPEYQEIEIDPKGKYSNDDVAQMLLEIFPDGKVPRNFIKNMPIDPKLKTLLNKKKQLLSIPDYIAKLEYAPGKKFEIEEEWQFKLTVQVPKLYVLVSETYELVPTQQDPLTLKFKDMGSKKIECDFNNESDLIFTYLDSTKNELIDRIPFSLRGDMDQQEYEKSVTETVVDFYQNKARRVEKLKLIQEEYKKLEKSLAPLNNEVVEYAKVEKERNVLLRQIKETDPYDRKGDAFEKLKSQEEALREQLRDMKITEIEKEISDIKIDMITKKREARRLDLQS